MQCTLGPFHITTICHVPYRSLKCIRLDSHLDELQPCAGIHTAHSRWEYYSHGSGIKIYKAVETGIILFVDHMAAAVL